IVCCSVPPAGEALTASCLVATGPGDDLAVPHLVDVRVHQAGDQRLAEAEAGLHGGDRAVARDGSAVNRRPAACGETIAFTDTATGVSPMITSLAIRNFKAFRNPPALSLRPVTILAGTKRLRVSI